MQPSVHHDLPALFCQLGLPSEGSAIERFIDAHRPLSLQLRLCEAPFWSPQQAHALETMMDASGEWTEVVDDLNVRLRYRACDLF